MKHSIRWFYLILLALMVIGITRLRFNVQVLDILPEELPVVRGLKIYQENFSDTRELIVTVSGPDADRAEAATRSIAERLRTASNLVEMVTWQPPWLDHPGQAAELIGYLWLNQPPQVFGELTNRLAPDKVRSTLEGTIEQLATSLSPREIARLSYDPLGLTQVPETMSGGASMFGGGEPFASADGTFRILFVQARGKLTDYRACLDWLQQIKVLVASATSEFGQEIQVGYTGAPAFVAEISSGMETDLRRSVGFTMAFVVVLFWLVHRRLIPLLWLLAMLGLTLGGTLAIGGLAFGTLGVVSVGFAAILLGLVADYGVVLYQEAAYHPGISVREVRQAISPSIVWSAVTTAAAFLILNFGGLPGLAQLGSLVAIGTILGAIVMLGFFLPPLIRRLQVLTKPEAPVDTTSTTSLYGSKFAWVATVVILVAASILLLRTQPKLDPTADSLRPIQSPAYTAMEQIKTRLAGKSDPDWLVISGSNEREVARRLDKIESVLRRALTNNQISGFTLPRGLFPDPDHQLANLPMARALTAQRMAFRETAQAAGFTSNSLALAENIFATWERAAAADSVFWPSNDLSQWALQKLIARESTNLYALASVYPASSQPTGSPASQEWIHQLGNGDILLASWSRLGSSLLEVVKRDFWRVMLPMTILLLICLWLAFKSFIEMLLSIATFLFSALCLWALMGVAGWSWNLLNLLALPLLIGVGVDYSIHLQLALRRHHGNLRTTRRTTGRALFLCAATTVAGFGSNAWSSNGGLVSLGKVCAAGIGLTYLTSVFLLPAWWLTLRKSKLRLSACLTDPPRPEGGTTPPKSSGPSSFYRADLWRLGLLLVRILPLSISSRLSYWCVNAYWFLVPQRRDVVVQNLLPALKENQKEATRRAKQLYRCFALKLIDLWRYEAGMPIDDLLGESSGWEHFAEARAQKRGVLLVTPHLGNWEFGGPWLTRRGFPLQVITLPEPGANFTELRQQSRARWNIETLVIGDDPFAFIDVIRRLESGANVALLVDRPTAASAVEVELFGRPFLTSIAAAELARASGCVVLPVYLPRLANSYAARVLQPIAYDRAALRDRTARQQLTQDILRAFEPIILQHLEQWYHFVPIWPKK